MLVKTLIETITQENKGFSGARNTAFSCLKGSYITFLDSDDLLEEGAVEHLMRCAEAEDADIIQGNWTEFVIGGHAADYRLPAVRLPVGQGISCIGA